MPHALIGMIDRAPIKSEPASRVLDEIEADPACGVAMCEVPDRLPRKRGRKVAHSTVWRWANRGFQGAVVLETAWIGGARFTTTHALRRFHRARRNLECIRRGEPMPHPRGGQARRFLAAEGFQAARETGRP